LTQVETNRESGGEAAKEFDYRGGVMTASSRRLAQKVIAIVVIVALLDYIGFSPTLLAFFFAVGLVVWRAVRHSDRNETREIFAFYISADEILRDEERHWYGFEIAEIIKNGEYALDLMPDAPPLLYFTLGALYQRIGDYDAAAERLASIVENDLTEEHQRGSPSPQLRRYVQMLRNIEREPAIAPQALAAVRSLERARRARAESLLAECRQRIEGSTPLHHDLRSATAKTTETESQPANLQERSLSSVTPPRPISEVLQDVYEEDTTA
jgi:tetratricopeptide (TPR) repeat protein